MIIADCTQNICNVIESELKSTLTCTLYHRFQDHLKYTHLSSDSMWYSSSKTSGSYQPLYIIFLYISTVVLSVLTSPTTPPLSLHPWKLHRRLGPNELYLHSTLSSLSTASACFSCFTWRCFRTPATCLVNFRFETPSQHCFQKRVTAIPKIQCFWTVVNTFFNHYWTSAFFHTILYLNAPTNMFA